VDMTYVVPSIPHALNVVGKPEFVNGAGIDEHALCSVFNRNSNDASTCLVPPSSGSKMVSINSAMTASTCGSCRCGSRGAIVSDVRERSAGVAFHTLRLSEQIHLTRQIYKCSFTFFLAFITCINLTYLHICLYMEGAGLVGRK